MSQLEKEMDMKSPSEIVEVSDRGIIQLTNEQVVEWAKSIIKGHYNIGRYSDTNLKILTRDDS